MSRRREAGAAVPFDPSSARSIGRTISGVLRDDEAAATLATELAPHVGGAHRVGVTGAPGVGKSTLVAALARRLTERGERVGVVASDPVSPRSGGAFLGDRVRLAGFGLASDRRVFFRSLARRDATEGDRRARLAADVLDAAGFPVVFVETVGAGQSDLSIRDSVHTTVVVLAPDIGDEVQLLKAGILEIADIFVVNRCDRPGAERFRGLLEERVGFDTGRGEGGGWRPPVVLTEAMRGDGIDDLLARLAEHRDWCARPPARK